MNGRYFLHKKIDESQKTMTKITTCQLETMKHALGWPDNYRNYFATDEGSDDFDDCEALVDAGLMSRSNPSWVTGYVYHVTSDGSDLIEADKAETQSK